MFLRITRGRFDSSRYEEIWPLAQQVDAAARNLPGNQSCQTAIDRAGGKTISVSTWDTAQHANISRDTAPVLGDLVRRLQAIGVQIEAPEIYEIVS